MLDLLYTSGYANEINFADIDIHLLPFLLPQRRILKLLKYTVSNILKTPKKTPQTGPSRHLKNSESLWISASAEFC